VVWEPGEKLVKDSYVLEEKPDFKKLGFRIVTAREVK